MYTNSRWQVGRWIALGFLTLFAFFVAAMIFYMFFVLPPGTMMAGTYPYFPWGFGWIWVFFGFFVFFGLMRWIFWWPGRWGYYRHYGYGNYGRENEAYHILRERYARGEITKDQYDVMMRDLYQPPRQGV
mgnify:CR=1 FL=1